VVQGVTWSVSRPKLELLRPTLTLWTSENMPLPHVLHDTGPPQNKNPSKPLTSLFKVRRGREAVYVSSGACPPVKLAE